MGEVGGKLEYDFIEEEKEVKRIIRSRLGYGFKDEELPPSLRAKISNLARDLHMLRAKQSEYDKLMDDPNLEKQEEYEKQHVDEKYSHKIEALEAELEKVKIPGLLKLSSYVLLGMIAVPLYAAMLLPITIIVVVASILFYGFEALLTGLKILFLLLIPAGATIAWFIIRSNRIKESSRIKREIYEIRRRWTLELTALKTEYDGLRRRLSAMLKAKEEELHSLEKEFEADLSQTASEINVILNVIFQAKMDFGLLRSALKSKGLIMEKLMCINCEKDIKLPENGHVIKCSYCGKDVYAVDVFTELESIVSSLKNLTAKKDDHFH